MPEVTPQLLEALRQLLEILIGAFGAAGTLALFVLVGAAVAAYIWYRDFRTTRGFRIALDEKERSIQRLAEQERQWRIYFVMRDEGMSRQEAEKLIERNEFATPQEARERLEQRRRYQRIERKKKRKGR